MSKFLDERRTELERKHFYDNLTYWGKQGLIPPFGRSRPAVLIKLLNKPDLDALWYTMTSEDERIIKALAGPHSYTIYKMLLAKQASK